MKYSFKNLFASGNEELKAVLTQDSFATVLADDDLLISALILSDKRIYQVGNIYELRFHSFTGGHRVSRGKKVIDIQDITGTTVKETTRPLLGYTVIFFGILAGLLGILSDVMTSTIIMLVIGALIVTGGVFLSLQRKRKYLILEYAGGAIVLPVKFATCSEIDLFQGIISIEKGKVAGGNNELKECPFCAEKIQAAATICRYCGRDQKDFPKE
jgi:hypothetical protein